MAATCVGVRMMEAAVSGLLEHDLTEGELGETIRALREHGAVRGEASSAAVSGLLSCCNSHLLSAATRTEGLSLLSLVVEESCTDVFQQHCVSWIRSVLQVIQSPDPPRVVSMAVFVLRSLLAHSSALPELSREISTNHIPGLLTSLLGLRRQCLMPALEGIRSCLISYPRACGSLRGKLTAFFLSLLDEENVAIQELACQCFCLLPTLGSGFSQGVKHTENWERQMQSVLCSLHAVFQQLYQAAETDTTRYEGPGTELELPVLDDDGASSILQLVRRFTALAQCVRLLLRGQFPAPVRVPVSDILNLVCRVVNVSAKNLSWQGEEALKLLLLPGVHKTALDILEAAILACGPRLLPLSSVICRLFPQLLSSWASVRGAGGFPSGQEKPYSSLRGAVYRVLERWVTMCGVSAGVLQGMAHHSDILLAHLLSDITPPADSMKMSSFVQLGAKKQKVSEIGNGEFQSHRKREGGANTELCAGALRALCAIVLYGGSVIKDDCHRRLQELSIPLLIRLQQGPDQWTGPYTSSECRKQLYRLLLSLTLSPSPRLPAPLHCAIRIFRVGLTEENLQVSMFCSEALAICRIIIHPRVPSLQRPLPQHSSRPPMQAEVQRPPAPPLTFPATVPLNHLPLRTPVPPQLAEPPADALIPSPQDTFGGKTLRPIFIHYEKEEASDVEISLESDSDDSVVIVPEGLLQTPAPKSEPSPPSAKPPAEETPAAETPAQPVVPSPTLAAPLPPPACPGPSPAQMPAAVELPPPPPFSAPALPEGDMVININSSDEEEEEEEDDEDEEGMYDEEEDEFYDDDEEEEDDDLEGLDDEEEEFDDDDEGLTEEEDEEEDLDAEVEEDDEDVDDEDALIAEDIQMAPSVDTIPEPLPPIIHTPEVEEGPPCLSPVQEDDPGDTDLLMLVESEERETPTETSQDRLSETEVTASPSPPPILTPPPASPIQEEEEEEEEEESAVPDVIESEPLPELKPPAKEEELIKEVEGEEEEKKPKTQVVVEEEEVPEEPEDELRDAESMLADFIDCPPDDDRDLEPLVT